MDFKPFINKKYSIKEAEELIDMPEEKINFFCDNGLVSYQKKKKFKRKFSLSNLFELYVIKQIAQHIAIHTPSSMVQTFHMLANEFLKDLKEKAGEKPLQFRRG